MEMESKYCNLRSKTIFDFTRDENILKEVLSEGTFWDFKENPTEAIEDSKHFLPISNVNMLIEYSKVISDRNLFIALKKEYEDDLPMLFDNRKGVLMC